MKVSEVIATARSCELSNLSTSSFTDSRIIQFINLGIIELSKIKSDTQLSIMVQ